MRTRCAWMFLLVFSAMSLTAELWSNNRPILISYQNSLYAPVFGRDPELAEAVGPIDYRQLARSAGEWAIWPINRWAPSESDKTLMQVPAPPSRAHWLGTDDRGRDVFARLLYAYRTSLIYAISAWSLCALFGTLFGAFTGFLGGRVDLLGQRVVEVIATVPQLFLLLYLVSLFTPSLGVLIVLTAVLDWTAISHLVRAEVLRVRGLDYVEGARAAGASRLRVLTRHVLPNALTPLKAMLPFGIVGNISGLAVLDYLGFGLPAPTPSWGELLAQGQANLFTAWWLVLYPTLFLFLTLMSLAITADHWSEGRTSRRVVEGVKALVERLLGVFERVPVQPAVTPARRKQFAVRSALHQPSVLQK